MPSDILFRETETQSPISHAGEHDRQWISDKSTKIPNDHYEADPGGISVALVAL